MEKSITLTCKSVVYYSKEDEDRFFEWVNHIASIDSINGIGNELHIVFKNKKIPDNDLRELVALFYRYKIEMKQLECFLSRENKMWFYDSPKGYWHKYIFGSSKKALTKKRNEQSTMNKKIILLCSPLQFYTKNDETLFNQWIKKIKCIKDYDGVGQDLHLEIASSTISEDDLLDLMALFDRYKFDSSQLRVFINENNKKWFNK